MKILLNIDYQTIFGEQMFVNLLPNDHTAKTKTIAMESDDQQHWRAQVNIPATTKQVDYYYSVERSGRPYRHEWLVTPHRLEMNAERAKQFKAYDHWIDSPEESYLYSSALTDCVAHREAKPTRPTEFQRTVRLKVRAPQLRKGERLALTGAGNALGDWNPLKAIEMNEHLHNEWVCSLDASLTGSAMEFKFVVLDSENDVTPLWEDGANRTVVVPTMNDGDVIVYELQEARFSAIHPWKGAGTVVPIFSLRSHHSFGVGDFGDLRLMIDWAAQTRQSAIQVLPINDTTMTHTWEDSYPYNAISIYALHPQYADLSQLPPLADEERRRHYEALRQELNALPQIDYERVNEAKRAYLEELFAQEGKRTMAKVAYKRFFEENKWWLEPYANYCVERDNSGTMKFWWYVQFILDLQMKETHDYARKKGVILKGDIPIGVNREGVDVLMEPRYFNLNGQAGAPPDAFSTNGQNWGFPTYNWDEMLKDGCQWWVRRFRKMADYFDAYRIDHVLGFFRIWEIPIHSVHGLLGQFSPSLGMTREEIEAYGLKWNERLFTEPYIADWTLDRIFGNEKETVKAKFLDQRDDGLYQMKPEYDTQRKVEQAFADYPQSTLKEKLYSLISDVLFVRDRKEPDRLFHPRIAVQLDLIYEALDDGQRYAFNRLYNDYYYRRNNHFWYHEAMKKLPRLTEATRMLVCAEDLGMVPECVAWVIDELRILSLEIQSMPKDPNVRFGHLSRNPYRSVCTISTHDMPTLRQWWDEDKERTQDYYSSMLYRSGEAPHPLPGWLAKEIVSRHLTSPSMLCLLSLQDWLSIDESLRLPDPNGERINIPANPRHYWRWRMHLCIEDLMTDKDFSDTVKELIVSSGRI